MRDNNLPTCTCCMASIVTLYIGNQIIAKLMYLGNLHFVVCINLQFRPSKPHAFQGQGPITRDFVILMQQVVILKLVVLKLGVQGKKEILSPFFLLWIDSIYMCQFPVDFYLGYQNV